MNRDRDLFAEARAYYTVFDVWRMFYPSAPEPRLGNNRAPYREDNNPSVSIWDDGRAWKDQAEGFGTDVIEFIKVALGGGYDDVRDWLLERLGIDREDGLAVERGAYRNRPATPKPPKRISWPCELIEGKPETWAAFAKTRGWTPEGIELAVSRGYLRFGIVQGRKSYIVMDSTGRCAEIRDIKRQPFVGGKPQFPLSGVDKSWLPGAVHLVGATKDVGVILCEGAPDLISAIDLYNRYDGPCRWVCTSLLGSKCRSIHPDCAKLIKGRRVRIIPDADDAGDEMAEVWKANVKALECHVDVVRLPRDKDLTDVLNSLNPAKIFDV